MTASAFASEYGFTHLEVDDFKDVVAPNFDPTEDSEINALIDQLVSYLNDPDRSGSNLVVSWVLRPADVERFRSELLDPEIYVLTLAPPIEIAMTDRGDRELSEWERDRVAVHYEEGVSKLSDCHSIDNGELTPSETAARMAELLDLPDVCT